MLTGPKCWIFAGLLSFISSLALANDIENFEKTMAARFVKNENVKFSAMMLELIARQTEMHYSIANGKCETPELISFESGVNDFEEFRTATNSSLSRNFAGDDPESTYAVGAMSKIFAVGERMIARLRVTSAEFALTVNCVEIADRYFRDVLSLKAEASDMRKAQVGIEDVRERRRTPLRK
jgi:hypothetical protein